MQYRRFGKTGLALSVFSLGTMRCLASEAVMAETVHQAWAAGINHLETARGYGNSEVYLGRVFRSLPRDQIYLTSKLCPTPDAASLSQALDDSLARLQVDYLDCLALHGINTPQHLAWVTQPGGCFSVLQQAQAAGKIRHIGFSTHGPLELVLSTIQTGLFEFVNLHYYTFYQRLAPAIALAQSLDLGIFIISPADKGGQLYNPPQRLRELCHPLTPLGLNYRFLLSDPRITTLSVGPANAQELQEPLEWADQVGPLTPLEQARLQGLEVQARQALDSDYCRQCYACLPCPEDINIPEILRLRNLALAYDMQAFGQYRYQMLENAGHWFPGRRGHHCTDCGDCLPRCPEQLAIPNLLRDAHQRLQGQARRRLWD
ncbi:aldo/keto reductase [Synechocystis sp. LKSZ1]|uniref:aldo/keto reductase n=1 Tax=Synechocystis sp. LKSZ1 TaxID=3144951 RepID=UPI00336C0A02